MQGLRKAPPSRYALLKEYICSKREKEALSAKQEPSLVQSQIEERCEPLVSILAEYLMFVPKS